MAVSASASTVTVTATNSAGSPTQSFIAKVMPAGCVVELGIVTAGTIVSHTDSWDDEDGCRSSNATSAGANRGTNP